MLFNDCVILHMHLLTYTIDCFCFFFTGFWSRYSVLFQNMCNSAPYYITVKTLKAQKNKNMSMARKELNIWGSFPLPLFPLICLIWVCKALFFHTFELCIVQNTNKQKYNTSFVLNCTKQKLYFILFTILFYFIFVQLLLTYQFQENV